MAPYTRTGSLLGATLNLGATDYYQINGTPISPSEFLTTSTTTWTVPTGVNFITAICIGGGGAGNQSGTYNGGGGGGGLRYINNLPVTPGEILSLTVGAGGYPTALNQVRAGGYSSIQRGANFLVYANGGGGASATGTAAGVGGIGIASGAGPFGGTIGGGDGGNGGTGNSQYGGGGGGTGGYTGVGGTGGSGLSGAGTNGTGGGGGGGGAGAINGGGGGGVAPNGQGTSGTGGAYGSTYGGSGIGGSSGSNGGFGTLVFGGLFGGGGCGLDDIQYDPNKSAGGGGVVRILWGNNRSFPVTNTTAGAGDPIPVITLLNKKNSGIWDLVAVYKQKLV